MSKREAELKSKWTAEMKRSFPGACILEYATNGAPDREVVACTVTSRWEFKHATPDFLSPADQELTCCRIAACAHCRYVFWYEYRGIQRTMIVHPRCVIRMEAAPERHCATALVAEEWCVGFDMKWLVEKVKEMHRA